MATTNILVGYHPGTSFIYRLSGASKLLFFLFVSIAAMATYDTRLLLGIAVGSVSLFVLSGIRFSQVSFVLKILAAFIFLNIVTVYLFSPEYGVVIYGTKHLLLDGWWRFTLTTEELLYLSNLVIKYVCTVPLALLFLLTTHPSQLAASLHRIGLPYKIAYAVSLSLRYIPDIQEEFLMIRKSQEARGLELSNKAKLGQRIKGNLQIVLPLIFSSLSRIDTIATAMELRRFGKHKTRSWYMAQPMTRLDVLTISCALVVVLLTLVLFAVNGGRFYNPF